MLSTCRQSRKTRHTCGAFAGGGGNRANFLHYKLIYLSSSSRGGIRVGSDRYRDEYPSDAQLFSRPPFCIDIDISHSALGCQQEKKAEEAVFPDLSVAVFKKLSY